MEMKLVYDFFNISRVIVNVIIMDVKETNHTQTMGVIIRLRNASLIDCVMLKIVN